MTAVADVVGQFLDSGNDGVKITGGKSVTTYFVYVPPNQRESKLKEFTGLLESCNVKYEIAKFPSLSSTQPATVIADGPRKIRVIFKPSAGTMGVGERRTQYAENAVAIYCAAIQQLGTATPTNIVQDVVQDVERYISSLKIDKDPVRILTSIDPNWHKIAEQSAIAIIQALEGNYVFHRNSPEVQSIYVTFRRVGPRFNVNKWNPADIWAIRCGTQINLSKIKTIDSLNQWVADRATDQTVVGISLKAFNPRKGCSVSWVNIDKQPKTMGTTTFEAAKAGKSLTSSKDGWIHSSINGEKVSIQLRTFAPMSGFQAAIVSNDAAHGKIGYEALTKIFADGGQITLPSRVSAATRAKALDKSLLAEVLTNVNVLTSDFRSIILDEIYAEVAKRHNREDWLYSMFLATSIMTALKMAKGDVRDKIVREIVSYASSQLEISAVHMKVS